MTLEPFTLRGGHLQEQRYLTHSFLLSEFLSRITSPHYMQSVLRKWTGTGSRADTGVPRS